MVGTFGRLTIKTDRCKAHSFNTGLLVIKSGELLSLDGFRHFGALPGDEAPTESRWGVNRLAMKRVDRSFVGGNESGLYDG